MDDSKTTIGLPELLSEVDRDLDEFRKKHQGDYSVKNVTLWWELERERVLTRHASVTEVRKLRRARSLKWLMAWFLVGMVASSLLSAALRLLVR